MFLKTARGLQAFLFVIGFLILGYCAADLVNSRLRQAQGSRELDRILAYKPAGPVERIHIAEGALVGRVEIPKLHLSAVVFQGTNTSVLDQGVGHLDASALPGEAGNVVLAAHRDSFFRSLRDIHTGDLINVTTPQGSRVYQVNSTEIVDPTETRVMDPTPEPSLTLITCYPFYYVGHAPKRFIVHARDTQEIPSGPLMMARKKALAPREPRFEREPTPSRLTPEEAENLTYVFRASE